MARRPRLQILSLVETLRVLGNPRGSAWKIVENFEIAEKLLKNH